MVANEQEDVTVTSALVYNGISIEGCYTFDPAAVNGNGENLPVYFSGPLEEGVMFTTPTSFTVRSASKNCPTIRQSRGGG